MAYVVAFSGGRDHYQVPLALYQAGLLTRLVTDFYSPDSALLKAVAGRLRMRHRRNASLPSDAVSTNCVALAWQLMGRFSLVSKQKAFAVADSALSRAALKYAETNSSNLFLYANYAYDAFTSDRSREIVKGLFMYHPHTDAVLNTLVADFSIYPECSWSMKYEYDTSTHVWGRDKIRNEWRFADFIICASSFTARTLHQVGCGHDKTHVIPYGVDTNQIPFDLALKKGRDCRFLFVGQGVQRKGLHHLLEAWRRLRLPNATLTVIAYTIDPGIAKKATETVRLLGKQTSDDLYRHYNTAHVFVLPSLVEGFGLVYLEALAAGCFSIGTANTGLPDLRGPPSAVKVIEPGSVEGLCVALESAYLYHERKEIDHIAIRSFAATLSWERFRTDVVEVCRRFDPGRSGTDVV